MTTASSQAHRSHAAVPFGVCGVEHTPVSAGTALSEGGAAPLPFGALCCTVGTPFRWRMNPHGGSRDLLLSGHDERGAKCPTSGSNVPVGTGARAPAAATGGHEQSEAGVVLQPPNRCRQP
jgi:hypothetical protein